METSNKKAVKTLWAGHFAVDTYSGFVNPIMPFIASNLGISLALSTFILSLSHLCSSLMQPFFGYLSDIWRKRFFMFFGLLMASIFLPLIGIAHNIYSLSACLIIGSIGNGFFHPQATSFINICSSPKELTKNTSIFLAIGTIGFSAGQIISPFILQKFNAPSLVWTSIFGILIAFLIIKNVPQLSTNKETQKNKIHLKKALMEIFSNTTMRILITFSVLKSLATQSMSILLPFLWKDLEYDAIQIGTLLFCFLIAGAFGTFASAKLENILGTKKVMLTSFCAIFPLTILFALTYKTFPIISLIIFVIIGFFAMLSVPINMVLAHQIMPQYKSLISGFIGGFSWGVVGLSMSLSGLFAEMFGIVNVLLVVSFLPTIFSCLVKKLPERQI